MSDGALRPLDAARAELDGGRTLLDASPTAIDAAALVIDASLPSDAGENSVMSFFVTSTGSGANGGNLGGLSGADAKCQALASNAGAGARTWRAYLSTDSPPINARDRIGTGPWANQQGVTVATNLATLHNENVAGSLILTELGQLLPQSPLDHDILTGSTADGNLMVGKTCSNWTDSTDLSGGQVGHSDVATQDLGVESWNSEHDPQCSQSALNSTAGTGRFYCFAID